MVRFYADENVQRGIVSGLRRIGVDVLHVNEDGYAGRTDPEVFERANDLERVLVSRDDDMIVEAVKCQENGLQFTGVVYARQNVLSVGQCIADLQIMALTGESADFADRVWYLPL